MAGADSTPAHLLSAIAWRRSRTCARCRAPCCPNSTQVPQQPAAPAFNKHGSLLAVASSYMFEQGEAQHLAGAIFTDQAGGRGEVKPKPHARLGGQGRARGRLPLEAGGCRGNKSAGARAVEGIDGLGPLARS